MNSSVVTTLSCAAVLMLAASTLHPVALAGQLEGATLADTLKAGEKTLKLNGLGLRKKAMFKVYVGGLYLESPSKDAGATLASDRAKAIRLHFLARPDEGAARRGLSGRLRGEREGYGRAEGHVRQDARARSRREDG
jgi:hypothetical protein